MIKMKAGILIGHLNNKGNEGAIIRTAETFGISNVFVLGKKQSVYKSAEGCDRHVNFFEFDDINKLIGHLKFKGHSIVCIENLNGAQEICKLKKYPSNPVFITGNENTGIPKELLDNSNITIKIEQGMGYSNCLNTHASMAIVLHFRKGKNYGMKPMNQKEN